MDLSLKAALLARVLLAVEALSKRVVASLEQGSRMRPAIMAMTGSRQNLQCRHS